MVLLYFALCMDNAVFGGIEEAVALEPQNLKAADSADSADREHAANINCSQETFAKDQLILAAELKPRGFRTKWQSRVDEGRRDARREVEVGHLRLLKNSQTLTGPS